MSRPTALDVVRHLSAWGLPNGPRLPLAVPGSAWSAVPTIAEFHRVTGPVLAAISHGAATGAPVALVDDLTERHVAGLRSALLTEADLVAVSRRLGAHGIAHRVLKGGATAHLDHHDPAMRRTSDVDLLVAPDQLGVATAAVRDLVDHERTTPDRSVRWTERYGKDRTLAMRDGGWIDLHRALVPGFHAIADGHDWFATADTFTLAGTPLLALARPDRLVHAVVHAGFADQQRLHSLRDVPLLIGAVDDWRTVFERHDAWQGLLARGIRSAWAALGLGHHPVVEWARSVTPGRRERLALRTFDLQGSRQHWGAVLAVGPHRWPGLLGPLVMPSRDYLDRYGRTPVGHVRATMARMRSARSD